MSQSSAISLELPLAIPAKVGRARFNGSPTRLRVLPSVGKRELILRHRPSKPLRRPLSDAEVLEHQRSLVQLKAEESALFSVAGPGTETQAEPTSEARLAAEAVPASPTVQEAVRASVVAARAERQANPVAPRDEVVSRDAGVSRDEDEGVSRDEVVARDAAVSRDEVVARDAAVSRDEVVARNAAVSRDEVAARDTAVSRDEVVARDQVAPAAEPIVVNTAWRRAALPAGVFVLVAGVGAYMLTGTSPPEAVVADTTATPALQAQSSTESGSTAAASEPASSKQVVRWKTAADRSSAKAEELSVELVLLSKQNKSLTRKVGLLEAETLDLQTELLERELDVVSLTAELEDVTDRRTIYNITNLPIDGGPAPASADEEVYTPPPVVETTIGVEEPSGYSTAGQAMNAGNL